MRVTRHEEFEVAHLLPGYDGGCGNLHGHTYKIEVTVEGPQKEPFGFVVDFALLKKAIKEVVPDHRYICSNNGFSLESDIKDLLERNNIKYVVYDFPTTAENMSKHYASLIDSYLKYELGQTDVNVVEVKLWETTNSYATAIKGVDF